MDDSHENYSSVEMAWMRTSDTEIFLYQNLKLFIITSAKADDVDVLALVCLSASSITQKVMDGFEWNVQEISEME